MERPGSPHSRRIGAAAAGPRGKHAPCHDAGSRRGLRFLGKYRGRLCWGESKQAHKRRKAHGRLRPKAWVCGAASFIRKTASPGPPLPVRVRASAMTNLWKQALSEARDPSEAATHTVRPQHQPSPQRQSEELLLRPHAPGTPAPPLHPLSSEDIPVPPPHQGPHHGLHLAHCSLAPTASPPPMHHVPFEFLRHLSSQPTASWARSLRTAGTPCDPRPRAAGGAGSPRLGTGSPHSHWCPGPSTFSHLA